MNCRSTPEPDQKALWYSNHDPEARRARSSTSIGEMTAVDVDIIAGEITEIPEIEDEMIVAGMTETTVIAAGDAIDLEAHLVMSQKLTKNQPELSETNDPGAGSLKF